MKSFVPYILIAFVVFVAMQGQLAEYLGFATTVRWNVTIADLFGGSGQSGSSGDSGGIGGVVGQVGQAAGAMNVLASIF